MSNVPSPDRLLTNRITLNSDHIQNELKTSYEDKHTYLPVVSPDVHEGLVFYAHQLYDILTPGSGLTMDSKMPEAIFAAAKIAEAAGSEFISPGPRQMDRQSHHIEGDELAGKIMDVSEKYINHVPILESIAMTALKRVGLEQNNTGLIRPTRYNIPLYMVGYFLIGTDSENQKLYLAEQSFAAS
ncbi:hypothetical protein A2707_00945 [Candidatus Saccharibacteria bacterium RIFCSPHIGHO2_01_FULL_45_15]|nr:MAG: hypothetical protein A2707_00945 [Candidatus Saccharibacteria bacterium RIFCSPHIGHO2_01_FULL_45_15]OGL26939.1 MAG: hypothetical protein A3C39_02060 [Candidatus Saccharibacteria bacterium RIFCSPHIGHO2_02_FULL_46_12]OGL32292.1 MAG: hypothetical protein A3E76_02765 [Candidatus Saccharibacteria bacterium RIFCSPHIGHO2_12_FULL_44_22]